MLEPTINLATVANDPTTSPLTQNNVESAAGDAGVGLAQQEFVQPTVEAPPQIQDVPPPPAPPEGQPTAPDGGPPVQDAIESGIPQFKDDPLGALGLIFSSTAAGLEGRPSPVIEMRQMRLAEQKQRHQAAIAVGQAVTKFLPNLQGKTKAQAAGLIDNYAGTFASGGGSAAFGNEVKEALVATITSIEQNAITPENAGALGSQYKNTLETLITQGSIDPVSDLMRMTSTEGGRNQLQYQEDVANLDSAMIDVQNFAGILDASEGTELNGKQAFHQFLTEKNGDVQGMPIITDTDIAALPAMMLKLAGDEGAIELTREEVGAIDRLGRNDVAQLLGAVYQSSDEVRKSRTDVRASAKEARDAQELPGTQADRDIEKAMALYDISEADAFALQQGWVEVANDAFGNPTLVSKVDGVGVPQLRTNAENMGYKGTGDAGTVTPQNNPNVAPQFDKIPGVPHPNDKKVSLLPIQENGQPLDAIEAGTGPFDWFHGVAERIPVLASVVDGEDNRQANAIFGGLAVSFNTAFANNTRFPVAQTKMIEKYLSPKAGPFSTVTSVRADLTAAKSMIQSRVAQETAAMENPQLAPKLRQEAQAIVVNGNQFLGMLDEVLDANATILPTNAVERDSFYDSMAIGTTYRLKEGGAIKRKTRERKK